MQLSNTPGKLLLPFAAVGGKNTIPVDSQIGIVAGKASLSDGFPPLTRTPLSAGGVPPSGLDMNGILYEMSAVIRWANAGGGYAYDGTFAADANVGGYPKGARVMRSDGVGYWINTVENNETDPEDAGAAAAGWVPDYTSGAADVTMTNANVTLTPLEYGKQIVIITGALTANLNLIFPPISGHWFVINKTTGAFSITAKTTTGVGVPVFGTEAIICDGVDITKIDKSQINIKSFGAKGDGVADDTAAFNAAIAFANAKGGNDRANVPGTTIFIPDGHYKLTAQLTPITVSGVYFVGSSRDGAVLLIAHTAKVFYFGDSSMAHDVVGGGVSNVKIEYTVVPLIGSSVFYCDYAFSLQFQHLTIVNTGTLCRLGFSMTRQAGEIRVDDVNGAIANAGFPLIDLLFGTGFFMTNCHCFVYGVNLPPSPATPLTTVAGTHAISTGNGLYWDTAQFVNCIFERFDRGMFGYAQSTATYMTFRFTNVVFDFHAREAVYLDSGGGGSISNFRFDSNCWYCSWSEAAIKISGATGFCDKLYFGGDIGWSGKEGVTYFNPTAKECLFSGMSITGVNKVGGTTAAMMFQGGSKGFYLSNIVCNHVANFPFATSQATYGLIVGADCDNYIVTGCSFEGSTDGYSLIPNTIVSANRKVFNNLHANYAGGSVGTVPASTIAYTNTSAMVEEWTFSGGTLTSGYNKNGFFYPGLLPFMFMRLEPGDYFSVGYSAVPTAYKFVER